MTTDKTTNMYQGIAAAPGIAIKPAYLFKKDIEIISDESITDVDEAIGNFNEALEKSKKELAKVFNLAVDKLGKKRAALFEAQIMILDDPILIDRIINRIKDEKKNSEFIVNDEISKYQDLMTASHEPYMKERSQDIEDIKNRDEIKDRLEPLLSGIEKTNLWLEKELAEAEARAEAEEQAK